MIMHYRLDVVLDLEEDHAVAYEHLEHRLFDVMSEGSESVRGDVETVVKVSRDRLRALIWQLDRWQRTPNRV